MTAALAMQQQSASGLSGLVSQAVLDAMATVRPLPKAAALESKYAEYTRLFGDMFEGRTSVADTCGEIDRMMTAAIVGS
jgi:hypothetical protein